MIHHWKRFNKVFHSFSSEACAAIRLRLLCYYHQPGLLWGPRRSLQVFGLKVGGKKATVGLSYIHEVQKAVQSASEDF